jgi:Holliday junction resolvase
MNMSNMQQIKCEKPFSDKQIGEIGEHAVIQKLMENGWYAMNWNMGFNNMKSVDIVCFNPDERKTVNIQVKTAWITTDDADPNIITGLISDSDGNITPKLDEKIIGPWVFVTATGEKGNMRFRYYILTKDEVKRLINDTNHWYVVETQRGEDGKGKLKGNVLIGLYLHWIKGDPNTKLDDTVNRKAFKHGPLKNPLHGIPDPENKWDKIWK